MTFFNRTFIPAFFAVVLSPMLLIGCQNTPSATHSQTAQSQPLNAEHNQIMQLQAMANQGNAEAQYQLGLMYDTGDVVMQDYSKAFAWYKKAAEQGHAGAQSKLGSMYRYGKGIEINHSKAVQWYWKAAEQGNQDAQYELGTLYMSK